MVKKIIIYSILAGAFSTLFLLIFLQQKQIKLLKTQVNGHETCRQITDSLQKTTDELKDELFNAKCMNDRYELSIDYLRESDPGAAEKIAFYFSHRTE